MSCKLHFLVAAVCDYLLLPQSSILFSRLIAKNICFLVPPLLLLPTPVPSSYARELRDFHIHVQLNWAHRRTGRGKEMGKQERAERRKADCRRKAAGLGRGGRGRGARGRGSGRGIEQQAKPPRPGTLPAGELERERETRRAREENSAASIRGGRRRAVAKQL